MDPKLIKIVSKFYPSLIKHFFDPYTGRLIPVSRADFVIKMSSTRTLKPSPSHSRQESPDKRLTFLANKESETNKTDQKTESPIKPIKVDNFIR